MTALPGVTLEGRVAVVTGGAGGIGSSIVADLAAMGAQVAICDVDKAGADAVIEQVPTAQFFAADLSDPDSVAQAAEAIVAAFGRVDVLVSNAGWDKVGPFVDSDPALWDRLYHINLRAPMQLTHAFLPGMRERGWGRLVFVASDAARVGSTGEAAYAACKAGLLGFSKTLARESAKRGVTSNVVCPGPSDTPLLAEVAEGNERLVASLERHIPIGRLGRPSDVSGAVAFLASERAEFITGQTISVSGGLTMV